MLVRRRVSISSSRQRELVLMLSLGVALLLMFYTRVFPARKWEVRMAAVVSLLLIDRILVLTLAKHRYHPLRLPVTVGVGLLFRECTSMRRILSRAIVLKVLLECRLRRGMGVGCHQGQRLVVVLILGRGRLWRRNLCSRDFPQKRMLHQSEDSLLDNKPTRRCVLITAVALLLLLVVAAATVSVVRSKSNGERDDLSEVDHFRRQREGVWDIKGLPDSSVVGDILVVRVLRMRWVVVVIFATVQSWRRDRGTV